MKTFTSAKALLISIVITSFFTPAFGETPEEKGLRIAQMVADKNEGFQGESSKMEMVLIDAYGEKTTREMEGKVRESENDGDKSLMEFLNPKDVKGTKMLTWSHKNEDDDQWLYLPSIRRVKRISSSSKSSSFMGSEFSYEDLGSQEVEKYTYKFLRDDKFNDRDVWVVERVSKKKSGYSKQVIYFDKGYMSATRIDYYDRKNELLKTAEFGDYKKYKVGKKEMYRSNKIHMKNVQTKKQSIFAWKDRKLGKKFRDSVFSKRKLK